jgi:hypothetical protein
VADRRDLVFKLCNAIIRSNFLGEMVKDLRLSELMKEWLDGRPRLNSAAVIAHRGQDYTASEMDQLLRLMLPHLIRLETLSIHSTAISKSVFTWYATSPAPSSLTSLTIESGDYSLVDFILPLFPSLEHLRVNIHVINSLAPTANGRPLHPLDPPRRLTSLNIFADYECESIRDLLASTESTEMTLMGWGINIGLVSLRNSEIMKELTVECYGQEEDEEILDAGLLKFTQLTTLRVGSDVTEISNHFWTDYFKSNLCLEVLHFTEGFRLESSDLLRAFKSRPPSLKRIVLDTFYDMESMSDEDDIDTMLIIQIYGRAGVEVSGATVRVL